MDRLRQLGHNLRSMEGVGSELIARVQVSTTFGHGDRYLMHLIRFFHMDNHPNSILELKG